MTPTNTKPSSQPLSAAQQIAVSQAAAIAQINSLPLQERVALLVAAENDSLMQVEVDKPLPIPQEKFSLEECQSLKAHLLDGGGTKDDNQLCLLFVNALLDEDWPTVFLHLPHIVKSWLKIKGIVVPAGDAGGVVLNNAGPVGTPVVNQNLGGF